MRVGNFQRSLAAKLWLLCPGCCQPGGLASGAVRGSGCCTAQLTLLPGGDWLFPQLAMGLISGSFGQLSVELDMNMRKVCTVLCDFGFIHKKESPLHAGSWPTLICGRKVS